MAKREKKADENIELVANSDHIEKVDANCNHPKKGEKYNQLHEALRKAHYVLGKRIEPQIYGYEFLIR